MKSVINAVSAIIEDVRLYERRPQRVRSDVDQDVLRALREQAEATLSNLVTASKTRTISSGMSPISLLKRHLSATVTG
jgi:protein SPA2